MKKLILTTIIALSLVTVQKASAQISVNINIGSQPDWGPVGYDHVDYYYLPDVDAYYDVPSRRYVYLDNNVWVHRTYLPVKYRNYNLYNGYKVVVNEQSPWMHHTVIRDKYVVYRNHPGQGAIRDSRDAKYTQYRSNNGNRKVTKVKVHNHNNGHTKTYTKVKVDKRDHGRGHDRH